jgi:hypothetical protein
VEDRLIACIGSAVLRIVSSACEKCPQVGEWMLSLSIALGVRKQV